jgi:toxin ParE1/3/4
MPFEVEFTEAAANDLQDIEGFVSGDSPEAAERISGELLKLALSLTLNPLIGRISPEYRDPTIRDIVHSKYRIVNLVNEAEERIQILRF